MRLVPMDTTSESTWSSDRKGISFNRIELASVQPTPTLNLANKIEKVLKDMKGKWDSLFIQSASDLK